MRVNGLLVAIILFSTPVFARSDDLWRPRNAESGIPFIIDTLGQVIVGPASPKHTFSGRKCWNKLTGFDQYSEPVINRVCERREDPNDIRRQAR